METPIPTTADPALLVSTLKNQAKLLELFEARGFIDSQGQQLEQALAQAIQDLEAFLHKEG